MRESCKKMPPRQHRMHLTGSTRLRHQYCRWHAQPIVTSEMNACFPIRQVIEPVAYLREVI
jgi:hypothetical protein